MSKITLETPRLKLQEPTSEDFIRLLRIYRKEINMRYIQDGKHDWTLEDLKTKWNGLIKGYSKGYGFWMVLLKSTNKLIGEGGFLPTKTPQKILEIGYMLDESQWGNGLGTELCQALINYGFTNLKLEKIVAGTWHKNVVSQRILKKCGLQFIEKKPLFDDITYQLFAIQNPNLKTD